MKLTDDEIAKEIEYLRHAEENDAADMILALKARAEAAEASARDGWGQRNAIYAELTKAQARADAAEKERDMLKAALERRGEVVFGREGD